MYTPFNLEHWVENGIYQAGKKWYANIFSPHSDRLPDELEGKVTARDQYEEAYDFGVNDASAYAMKIVRKGNRYGLFAFHGFTTYFTGYYICHDTEVYVYDEIQAFCDWEYWSDWGYALCRQGNKWKVVKITQFPYAGYDIIATGVNSRDEALAVIGVTDLRRFETYDGKIWERRKFDNFIHHIEGKWYLNVYSPYTGVAVPQFEGKISDQDTFEWAEGCDVQATMTKAAQVLHKGEKKALFVLSKYPCDSRGLYVCHDSVPFSNDEVRFYSDIFGWENYGFALCRKGAEWTVIKVTQFPEPVYEVMATEVVSLEEALKIIGVTDETEFEAYNSVEWSKRV